MIQPPDVNQRQQALDPHQSFICEAPAGSGKTELLIQRFLTLLARVRKPEEILAITFTRKATGEMRERILSALHSANAEQPQEAHKQLTWNLARAALERDKQHHWQLLQNPNRLQIKTFDSLCASLAKHLPVESQFGALPQLTEDADDLYRHAVRALLATLEEQNAWTQSLSEILQLLDNRFDKFESMMLQLLAQRGQWLPLLGRQDQADNVRAILERGLQSVLRDTIEKVRALIPFHLQRELLELAGFAAANLRAMDIRKPISACLDIDIQHRELPGHSDDDIPKWIGLTALLTTFAGKWRGSVDKRVGFPVGDNAVEKQEYAARKQQLLALIANLETIDGLQEALGNIRQLPRGHLDAQQWQILSALFDLLPVLVAQLHLVFQERNSIDFTALSLAAQQALGALDEPTQLALKLDYRLSHILVDEFQDTSTGQVDLLNLLTAGWSPEDGRTLFCVGDAMQSIYGFRGANVGLFLQCREHGLANVPLQALRLSANFRSQAGVVEWINRVFQHAFPRDNNISTGAVSYSPSIPVQEKTEKRSVWVHSFIDNPDTSQEAQIIRGVIRKNQQDDPDARIAILVRNREHASHITPVLKDAGLPYRAVELEPLQDHSVIQDLMALTRALWHPGDRTAWLAILRAPWCGLGLVDLEAVANFMFQEQNTRPTVLQQCLHTLALREISEQRQQEDLFFTPAVSSEEHSGRTLSNDGRERLERIIPTLQIAADNRERKTLRDWVEGTWLQLGGPACLEDATALENAEVFFRLLETWEYPGDLPSLDHLYTAVRKLYATPNPKADERLQIMTIHKSKGLEFDVVIVPSLQRRPRTQESSLLMWQERLNAEGENELLMAPYTTIGERKHPTYLHLRSEENKKQLYENCRLLYVACTRARKQLHLTAQVRQDPKDSLRLRTPPRNSLLYSIWEPVQTRLKRYPGDAAADETTGETGATPRALHRLTRRWRFPALTLESTLENYIPPFEFGAEKNRIELHWESLSSRATGSVIHIWLQLITESGIDNWDAARIDQQAGKLDQALRDHGIGKAELDAAREKIQRVLKAALADPRAREILSNRYAFSHCEFPVTLKTQKGPLNLVIDRLYTDDTGDTWIIDYKSSEPQQHESAEHFLEREAAQYQEKMALYRYAVEQLGYSPVRTALFFPVTGDWVELED